MKSPLNYLRVALLAALLIYGCENTSQQLCNPGATQSCLCSDDTVAEQVCKEDGSGWETCECVTNYSYWNDSDTNLTWQDPQKDAYKIDDQAPGQKDAARYCEELVLGGYDDWRLPNIDELRTLVRGHTGTMTDGECPVTEGSERAAMFDSTCAVEAQYEGPGDGGCYWAPELTGTCNKEDLADEFNKPLETVSSTIADDDVFWVACILFDRGSVSYNHIYSYADVRCVRDGPTSEIQCADGPAAACAPGETQQCEISSVPVGSTETALTGVQICTDDGKCWGPCESTSFTPSPPVSDVSETCDQIELTINVPEKLPVKMSMLVAFLYQSEGFTLPPGRPPDGGTNYNQVLDPDIDLDKPFKMTVPACSYYRDRCIPNGEYKLYVSLLQSDAMPPTPKEGDYYWVNDQEPLTLQTGTQQVIQMEITMLPW